jgi:hypothetical protein
MPLRDGALQENWGLDARFSGDALDGEQRLALPTSASTGIVASLTRQQEFAVRKAVFAAGVAVSEPLFASEDSAVSGKPFFIMRRADEIAAPDRVAGDTALDPALPAIAKQLGRASSPTFTRSAGRAPISRSWPAMRKSGRCSNSPGFAPMSTITRRRCLCSNGACAGSRRTPFRRRPGALPSRFPRRQLPAEPPALAATLDWEFAGWGDPYEDIGWFCRKRLALCAARPGGRRDCRPHLVLQRLSERIR